MKNVDRQKSLDKQKWAKSEKQHQDMSGKMPYCKFCDYSNAEGTHCSITQEQRVRFNTCATAYNRFKRFK